MKKIALTVLTLTGMALGGCGKKEEAPTAFLFSEVTTSSPALIIPKYGDPKYAIFGDIPQDDQIVTNERRSDISYALSTSIPDKDIIHIRPAGPVVFRKEEIKVIWALVEEQAWSIKHEAKADPSKRGTNYFVVDYDLPGVLTAIPRQIGVVVNEQQGSVIAFPTQVQGITSAPKTSGKNNLPEKSSR